MKKILTYKNIVTALIFFTIWCILFLVVKSYNNYVPINRYQIVSSSGLTILLDTQTGLAWRNVYTDNKERIPNCWQMMDYPESVLEQPIGARINNYNSEISDELFDKIIAKGEISKLSIKDKIFIKLIQNFNIKRKKLEKAGYSEKETDNLYDLAYKSKPSDYNKKERKKYKKYDLKID